MSPHYNTLYSPVYDAPAPLPRLNPTLAHPAASHSPTFLSHSESVSSQSPEDYEVLYSTASPTADNQTNIEFPLYTPILANGVPTTEDPTYVIIPTTTLQASSTIPHDTEQEEVVYEAVSDGAARWS